MRLFYRLKEFFNSDIYEIKYWYQRAKRGYADRDVWAIDYYLNSFMPKMIRQLKETTHGYPGGLSPKKWDNILEKIALGFEAADRITDTKNWVMNEGSEMYTVPTDNPHLTEIKFTNDWTPEQVKHFKELDRKDMRTFKAGMDLFVKHYFSLWD